MTPTNRTDCIAFEPKNHQNDCGDCQTDGHYLCIGCRNIASFDDMEYHDNKMTYYFDEVVKTIVGEFFDKIFNMTPNKKRGGKREGAGAPLIYGEETTPVQTRVPITKVDAFKENAKEFLKQFKVRSRCTQRELDEIFKVKKDDNI